MCPSSTALADSFAYRGGNLGCGKCIYVLAETYQTTNCLSLERLKTGKYRRAMEIVVSQLV